MDIREFYIPHRARQTGVYEKLEKELRAIKSQAILEQWLPKNKHRILAMPGNWHAHAYDEYADCMKRLIEAELKGN